MNVFVRLILLLFQVAAAEWVLSMWFFINNDLVLINRSYNGFYSSATAKSILLKFFAFIFYV